jgi:hypothetical protein
MRREDLESAGSSSRSTAGSRQAIQSQQGAGWIMQQRDIERVPVAVI